MVRQVLELVRTVLVHPKHGNALWGQFDVIFPLTRRQLFGRGGGRRAQLWESTIKTGERKVAGSRLIMLSRNTRIGWENFKNGRDLESSL